MERSGYPFGWKWAARERKALVIGIDHQSFFAGIWKLICISQRAYPQILMNPVYVPAWWYGAGNDDGRAGGDIKVIIVEDDIGSFQLDFHMAGERLGIERDEESLIFDFELRGDVCLAQVEMFVGNERSQVAGDENFAFLPQFGNKGALEFLFTVQCEDLRGDQFGFLCCEVKRGITFFDDVAFQVGEEPADKPVKWAF